MNANEPIRGGETLTKREEWAALSARLVAALAPAAEPIGIAFLPPGGESPAPEFEGRRPAPSAAGRTGSVPAGCVFWMKAAAGPFSTVAEDHANCSVGSYTHGLLTLAEARRETTSPRSSKPAGSTRPPWRGFRT